MKNLIIIFSVFCLLFCSYNLKGQSWHTYFGDTLYFTTSTCPSHCPYVDVIYVDKDSIFIAGAIENAGDLFVMGIAKWHNYQWYNLGITFSNDDIKCFVKHEDKLWVGGYTGWYPNWVSSLRALSCWDGNEWTGPYTIPPNGDVFDVIKHNDTLFFCGNFFEIDDVGGGATVKAYHNGTWIGIGHVSVAHGMVYAIYNDELLLGTRYTGIYKRIGMTSWAK